MTSEIENPLREDRGQCQHGKYHHLYRGEWKKNKECLNPATVKQHGTPVCSDHVSGYHRCGWKN